jgi:hypothetical protein
MFWGLLLASIGAIFAWARGGYPHPFTDLRIMAMVIGVTMAWFFREGKSRNRDLLVAAVIYAAGMVPSLIFTQDLGTSLFGFPHIWYGSVLTGVLCLTGMLLANRLCDCKADMLRKAILGSGAILAVLCLAQAFQRDPFMFPMGRGGRVMGVLGNCADMGALLVAMFCCHKNPLYLVAAMFTGRGPMLGMAVAMFPVKIRPAAFIVASMFAMTLTPFSREYSDIVRTKLWKVGVSSFSLVGTGPANFSAAVKRQLGTPGADPSGKVSSPHAHNAIFDTMATKGVFGMVGLLAFLVAPEMAGLWTLSMFNPISFEVVFIACILVGLSRRKEGFLCGPSF